MFNWFTGFTFDTILMVICLSFWAIVIYAVKKIIKDFRKWLTKWFHRV